MLNYNVHTYTLPNSRVYAQRNVLQKCFKIFQFKKNRKRFSFVANSEVFRWNFSSNTYCEIKRSGFIIYISTIKYTYTHIPICIFSYRKRLMFHSMLWIKKMYRILHLKYFCSKLPSFQINFKCIFVYKALIGNFLFKTVKTKIIQKQSRI